MTQGLSVRADGADSIAIDAGFVDQRIRGVREHVPKLRIERADRIQRQRRRIVLRQSQHLRAQPIGIGICVAETQ